MTFVEEMTWDSVSHKVKTLDDFLDNLVAVHLTDYYPEDGVIKSHASATKGTEDYVARNTIHFTLNHPVEENDGGDWSGRQFAIVAPLRSLMETEGNHFVNLMGVDSYTLGDVTLPEDAVIVHAPGFDSSDFGSDGLKHVVATTPIHEAVRTVITENGFPYIPGYANRDSWNNEAEGKLAEFANSLNIDTTPHDIVPYRGIEVDVTNLLYTDWSDLPQDGAQKAYDSFIRLHGFKSRNFEGYKLTTEMLQEVDDALVRGQRFIQVKLDDPSNVENNPGGVYTTSVGEALRLVRSQQEGTIFIDAEQLTPSITDGLGYTLSGDWPEYSGGVVAFSTKTHEAHVSQKFRVDNALVVSGSNVLFSNPSGHIGRLAPVDINPEEDKFRPQLETVINYKNEESALDFLPSS
jgi:hypothetical protein